MACTVICDSASAVTVVPATVVRVACTVYARAGVRVGHLDRELGRTCRGRHGRGRQEGRITIQRDSEQVTSHELRCSRLKIYVRIHVVKHTRRRDHGVRGVEYECGAVLSRFSVPWDERSGGDGVRPDESNANVGRVDDGRLGSRGIWIDRQAPPAGIQVPQIRGGTEQEPWLVVNVDDARVVVSAGSQARQLAVAAGVCRRGRGGRGSRRIRAGVAHGGVCEVGGWPCLNGQAGDSRQIRCLESEK